MEPPQRIVVSCQHLQNLLCVAPTSARHAELRTNRSAVHLRTDAPGEAEAQEKPAAGFGFLLVWCAVRATQQPQLHYTVPLWIEPLIVAGSATWETDSPLRLPTGVRT